MRNDELLSFPLAKALLKLIDQDKYSTVILRDELLELVTPYLPYRLSVYQLSRILKRILPSGYPQMARTGRMAEGRKYLYVLPSAADFRLKCKEWFPSSYSA